MAFTYSTNSKRYHDTTTGKFVGRVEVRKQLDDVIDVSADRMKSWTSDLIDNTYTIEEWQSLMAEEVRMLHMSMAAAANGGWDAMSTGNWSRVENYLNYQYDRLEGFAEEIFTGEQVTNGTMLYRATLYAESARATYEGERFFLEKSAGSTQEMNILGGSDHCVDCQRASEAGWVSIGTLIPIGSRACQAKCHCTIIYRTGPKDTLGSEVESF